MEEESSASESPAPSTGESGERRRRRHRQRRYRDDPRERAAEGTWKSSPWLQFALILAGMAVAALVLVAVLNYLDRAVAPPPPKLVDPEADQ
jgi:hypothetical protein